MVGFSAVRTSKKGWEIVATKSVQDLVISIQKKNLKGFLWLTIVICNKNPSHPGGDFNVSRLQFFSGCPMAQLSFDDCSLHGHSYDS